MMKKSYEEMYREFLEFSKEVEANMERIESQMEEMKRDSINFHKEQIVQQNLLMQQEIDNTVQQNLLMQHMFQLF